MSHDKARSAVEGSRYQRAVELFLGACELAPDRRAAFVREACADDGELLAATNALLAQDATSDDLIDGAAASAAALLSDEELPLPERIGGYRVVRVLGEGGMGTVYEAEQESPRRRVALKVVRPAMATPRVCRRFELEAEVLGRLEHPGIARIYEAGSAAMAWGVVPFLAMELVRGRPLDDHAREATLDLRARLALLARVCDAVDHAHRHGVVHRDLKPANVLVDEQGDPKVLDFGVAWLAAPEAGAAVEPRTALTLEGQLVGTLAYMSPEQVRGERDAIDARADVYALGAIGYELLTGRLPLALEGRPLAEAARLVADFDPPPPSLLAPECAGDVDVLFAKALEKEPARRYPSAAEFAADLRRFLAEQPIVARPASRAYQLRKFARRNRAIVGGVAIAFAALLAGTAFSLWKAAEASDARDLSDARARDAQRNAYRANLIAASTALRSHHVSEAEARLDDAPERLRDWEWRHLRARLDESVALFAAGSKPLAAIALDAEMQRLATGASDGTVRLWDWATGAPLAQCRVKTRQLDDVAFEREGAQLQVASSGAYPKYLVSVATLALPSLEVASTWSTPTRGSELRFPAAADRVAVQLWTRGLALFDRASGKLESESEKLERASRVFLSPDGQRAALAWVEGGGLEVRDVERGAALFRRDDLATIRSVRFDAGASRIVVATAETAAHVLDGATGQDRLLLAGHGAGVTDAQFAADGGAIYTSSADGTLRVFETAFGSCTHTLHGHRGAIERLEVSSDGRTLVTAGRDGAARRWDLAAVDETVIRHPATVYPVAISPDGRRIATGCLAADGPGLHLWDAESGERIASWIECEVTSLAWSRDGTRLAVGRHNKPAIVVDAATGATLRGYGYHRWNTDSIAFGAGDRELATAGLDGVAAIKSVEDGKTSGSLRLGPAGAEPIYRVAYSPDGALLAASRNDGTIVLLDAATRAERAVLLGHAAPVVSLAFSNDGRWLASGARDGRIVIASVPDGAAVRRLDGHVEEVFALAFSPDGARLVSGGRDRTIRVWDPATGDELVQLDGHTSFVYALAFSPDGRTLVSGGGDATARIWDTRSAAERAERRRARERLAAKLAATVEQALRESPEPRAAVERLRRAPFLSEREREVALQLALARFVAQ